MRLFRPGLPVRLIYRRALFRLPEEEGKVLYLSFDDGPNTGSTENILGVLEKHRIRAIFFCTGKSAETNPSLMSRIRAGNHVVGNHGFLHLDGFKTSAKEYTDNLRKAAELTSAWIFRPPYGRLTPSQYKSIRKDCQIVFWDLMPYDFDVSFPASGSLNILKQKIRPGSVIVFHDMPGSSVHTYLDEFILYSLSQGYRFEIPGQFKKKS